MAMVKFWHHEEQSFEGVSILLGIFVGAVLMAILIANSEPEKTITTTPTEFELRKDWLATCHDFMLRWKFTGTDGPNFYDLCLDFYPERTVPQALPVRSYVNPADLR